VVGQPALILGVALALAAGGAARAFETTPASWAPEFNRMFSISKDYPPMVLDRCQPGKRLLCTYKLGPEMLAYAGAGVNASQTYDLTIVYSGDGRGDGPARLLVAMMAAQQLASPDASVSTLHRALMTLHKGFGTKKGEGKAVIKPVNYTLLKSLGAIWFTASDTSVAFPK